MLRALWSGATGMKAQQFSIDVIANNLSNVNTTGFKNQRVQFQDLYYQNLYLGDNLPLSVGNGAKVVSTDRNFRQGNLEATGNLLDAAIQGPGFFVVETPDGGEAYTRDGSFRVDGQGYLVTSGGYKVLSESGVINVPDDARDIAITEGGSVSGIVNGEHEVFAMLKLCTFRNSAGLETSGANLYRQTQQSGEPADVDNSITGVMGGYLETSNVEVVSEMVNLIVAQRAFELNSKTIETADHMWNIANNVRR